MLVLALACATATEPARCNGSAALCDRPLDEVAFAGTHNAMSSEERGWLGPNQHDAVPTQLASGIRGINLDLHDDDGVPSLCHGSCALGSQPLAEGLAEIAAFLGDNPSEVVVITFESYLPAEIVADEFAAGGLLDLVHAHPPGQPWPTLGDLVAGDERAVVFTSDPLTSDGDTLGWYHDQWAWWVDTPYHFESIEELRDDASCEPHRGSAANDLYNVNHFITDPIALEADAAEANADAVLRERVLRCADVQGRIPNQVLVDFYDLGAVLDVVDTLNEGT